MKIKINQIRTYDDAGYRQRAACLCFRSECEAEILLVSSSRFHDIWIVPGGGLEPGEDPATTAVREVHEEAGVVGQLGRLIDVFENNDRNTRTYVYVLIVEQLKEDYDDAKGIGRMRKWFSLAEANRMLSQYKPVQKEYIEKLCQDQDHLRRVSLCGRTTLDSNFPTQISRFGANVCRKCQRAYSQQTCPSESCGFVRSEALGIDKQQLPSCTTPEQTKHWKVDNSIEPAKQLALDVL
uniref:diphosphoinositol-polyphosphate diphosphatase n=1 Tax=Ciona savignyi TaxID=51511 RepID=H2YFQ0_CIOSA